MKRSLRSWLWRVPLEQEIDEELAFHIEMRTRELVERGMDPQTARKTASRRLGSVPRLKRTCMDLGRKRDRKMRLTQWLEELQDDVKGGFRQLTGAPTFALVAGITLALGIGINSAAFAVVKSVLVDALPYADADRLVRVYGRFADGSQERGPLSAGTVDDIASRQQSFTSLTAFQDLAIDAVYGADEGPQLGRMVWVEPGFFETLGVAAARGRTFALTTASTASFL
jgi:putative ABC transport system permease protein